MSYSVARQSLGSYRAGQIAALLGKQARAWFTSLWDSVGGMLGAFSSDEENKRIAAKYVSGLFEERAADHVRLDYVCALRREVRKQYVSGEGDVCTDVTPFRHGVISAHGADLFDKLMDTVVSYGESQAKGGTT